MSLVIIIQYTYITEAYQYNKKQKPDRVYLLNYREKESNIVNGLSNSLMAANQFY